jgi:hypothetical protein
MSTSASQTALFTVETTPIGPVVGVPVDRFDPAAYDTALTDDGYGTSEVMKTIIARDLTGLRA